MSVEHDAIAPATMQSAGDEIVAGREDAAHERRNWVRLSYDCNNHCLFCLDSLAHNGTMRSNLDIKVQIIEGRKKGAERLILSGGEPTMHPNFLDFVRLGKRAGYPKVQTVTNGRMFAYPEFLKQAATNGLDEVTFSLHGHTPELHDGLVATPGAFKQEVAGLHAALASGRFIVNIDIVITKRNVRHLPDMLETFIGWGVKEFDLLHIIPFGAAWGRARDSLFYDIEGNESFIRRALEYSRRPDVHIWLNRFPPPYTEGFEELIQDPYKMNDEVRGRREEYDRYLTRGEKLSCRQPERCRHCYLEHLCDSLDEAIDESAAKHIAVLEVDGSSPPAERLPSASTLHVIAKDPEEALRLAGPIQADELWLELESYEGFALDAEGRFATKVVARCYATEPRALNQLAGCEGEFEIVAVASKRVAAALAEVTIPGRRLVLRQPNYDRVTAQRSQDVDLRSLCDRFPDAQTENIPPCIGNREPVASDRVLDAAMLGADGRIDMGRYTQRYVANRYYTKSRRCKDCRYDEMCPGVHINFVRAHGYASLKPELAPESAGRG